jgi:hypothetical protein
MPRNYGRKAIGAAGNKKTWLLHSVWYRMIKRLANLPVQYMITQLYVVTILKASLNNLPKKKNKNMPEAALGRYLKTPWEVSIVT